MQEEPAFISGWKGDAKEGILPFPAIGPSAFTWATNAVQEAFLSAFKALDGFQAGARLATWPT